MSIAPPKRNIVLAVDNSEDAQHACEWMMKNVYKQGDIVHILHVVPPGKYVIVSADMGAEEYLDEAPEAQQQVEEQAQAFIREKFTPLLEAQQVEYKVEVVKFSTDSESVGAAICGRAEEVAAVAVVLASHNKSSLQQFFQGSVTTYLVQHCRQPLVVLH